MIELTKEINEMLDEIIDLYESDTGRESSREAMISGLIRSRHAGIFGWVMENVVNNN